MKKRILLMDDEQMLRKAADLMLSRMGHEVALASDGETAIAMYQEALATGKRFDLVILDLTIPEGIGGKEAIKILRQIDPEIRAIVSSGSSNDPVVEKFVEHGFDDVLLKPYNMADLQRIVDETQ